jgi:Fic family protein
MSTLFWMGTGGRPGFCRRLSLYRSGYDFKQLFTISEYYDRDRPAYYRALQGAREQNLDLTGWLEYFCEGLARQLGEVQGKGESLIRQDVVALRHGLTGRQRKAVELAMEKGKFGIQDYEAALPGVTRRTLQRELKELVRKEVLRVEGATRNLSYALVEGS